MASLKGITSILNRSRLSYSNCAHVQQQRALPLDDLALDTGMRAAVHAPWACKVQAQMHIRDNVQSQAPTPHQLHDAAAPLPVVALQRRRADGCE